MINIGEIVLDSFGCYLLNDSFSEIAGAKLIGIAYWTNINPMSPVSSYAGSDGRCYIFGYPNTQIKGLKIYYWK